MNDHSAKPIDVDLLFSTISKWLNVYLHGLKQAAQNRFPDIGGVEIR